MYKYVVALFLFCFSISASYSQEKTATRKTKKLFYTSKEILVDSLPVFSPSLKIYTSKKQVVDSSYYFFDTAKNTLLFKKPIQDTLEITYFNLPRFLTKTYAIYDDKKIVPNEAGKLLTLEEKKPLKSTPLFNGLQTNGSISRAVTVGNNQNTVLNSNLDLQISGKLSNDVTLRASIQDSNIPLQEGGYSQKLDEFDQIFIELAAKNWGIRAGDLFLENRQSSFLNFNKKVQGLNAKFTWGNMQHQTTTHLAAALVRGQYAKSNFTGQEGNQGPYKLRGTNGELYVLVISGSERVYINGILLERGENKDYIIDYNAGEIIFNATKPITSEMRIVVEYQYSDRNFTRFLTYGGLQHERNTFKIGSYFYSESDVKNQPLQQSLSQEQIHVLQNAGDDIALMNAPSAYIDNYSENKILYRKTTIGSTEVFQFSTDASQTLYNVKFSFVGANQGNYILISTNAIGKIYEYIAPIAGIPQGNYEPIIRLIAPTKIQIATVTSSYNPSEKTSIEAELATSTYDKNLYSLINDSDNKGIAGKIKAKQRLFSKNMTINAFSSLYYVQENFKPIERLYNIEFARDWNILNPMGNQLLLNGGIDFSSHTTRKWLLKGNYNFEKLMYTQTFSGNKHNFQTIVKKRGFVFQTNGSAMKSSSTLNETNFVRNQTTSKYHWKKNYIGGNFRYEYNKDFNSATQNLTTHTQRFSEFGNFIGRGDSTKIFTEVGYLIRTNDSLKNNALERVNQSFSTYLNAQLVKTDTRSLRVFLNYRNLKFTNGTNSQPSFNSRIAYSDSYWNQLLQNTTFYETSSGTIAQQEFTYLEVDAGRGIYMWNDYNGNGIQELQEFEIATFPDLAKYVKIFLPNQVFVNTFQNRLSQSITFNGAVWQNATGIKKIISKFYNQTAFILDKKVKRSANNFEWNPFTYNENELIGLNQSFRNSLFYNKGKQRHAVTYNYTSNAVKNLLNFGNQENHLRAHQIQYAHLVKKFWLLQFIAGSGNSESKSDNYASRNFELHTLDWQPKVSFLFSKNASWEIFYKNSTKNNTIGNLESLKQQQFGTHFIWNSSKGLTSNGSIIYYNNDFKGNATSPVGFQLLEGLQVGKNITWQVSLQKSMTQYLDISLNYQGRKSSNNLAIHTGTIQLRAFF